MVAAHEASSYCYFYLFCRQENIETWRNVDFLPKAPQGIASAPGFRAAEFPGV